MDALELRSLGMDELKARTKQWGEELFRLRFKAGTTETKDTSIFKKLRKDIARAQTIMGEKTRSGELLTKVNAAKTAAPTDKVATPNLTEAKPATEKKKAKSSKKTKE